MEITKWKSLSHKQQETIVTNNEDRATSIDNADIPENEHCIVYCHADNTHGWQEINKADDLGLNALVARSWIKISDL